MNEVGKVHELTDIDVVEVSLVGSPAIKRKFLLVKNEEGAMGEKEVALSEAEKGILTKLMDFIKQMVGKKAEEPPKEPEKKKEETKSMDEATSKRLEAIEKERDTLKSQVDEANKRVDALQKADRKRKFDEIAKSMIGKTDDNVKFLESMADSLPEDKFNTLVEREKANAKILSESEVFKENGSNRPVPNSAQGKIDELVNSRVQKGEDRLKAIDAVMKEHPELYAEAKKEVKNVDKEH